MERDTVKEMYDFYPPADKNDFFIAYMYLKHMDIFLNNVLSMLGEDTVDLPEDIDPSVNEMLKLYVQVIAEAAPSRDTNIYHGKIIKHSDARKLVTLNEPVKIEVPEQVVPFRIARDVILDNPEAIAVGRCACRSNQKNPCVPPAEQEVCLIMGDPFASFIAEHNPSFRKCSQDEAVSILERAHKRGNVHAAYFKKEMGRRLMAICNCCSCCCMGMVMWNKLNGAIPFLASSGYVASLNDQCSSCGACAEDVCPFNALSMEEGASQPSVDLDKCMGCGVCEDACPSGAVELIRDESKGLPLDLDELLDPIKV